MKTASGLEYTETETGTGAQAIAGKTVKVHYIGKFPDGNVFDSSVSRGEPIEFVIGQGRVIKGWDEGIALMKVGAKAQLTIPPNATLVFDVELVEVK
jgi:peptidyl-prolyl cis-trans isomerase A (cyclophilin A)